MPDWVQPFVDAELFELKPWEVMDVPRVWFAWKRAWEAARAKAHES